MNEKTLSLFATFGQSHICVGRQNKVRETLKLRLSVRVENEMQEEMKLKET